MSQPRDVAEVPGSATEVRWYGVVLLVGHLALVLALFVTLPYGKFAHGLYRATACSSGRSSGASRAA